MMRMMGERNKFGGNITAGLSNSAKINSMHFLDEFVEEFLLSKENEDDSEFERF
jgi:hypothetical protein